MFFNEELAENGVIATEGQELIAIPLESFVLDGGISLLRRSLPEYVTGVETTALLLSDRAGAPLVC